MTGIELCRRFYDRAVAPLLDGVPHSAALLGDGSEVLGFDDGISPDHGFAPRVQVFLPDGADAAAAESACRRLDALPERFEGMPVVGPHPTRTEERPLPRTLVMTAGEFFTERIGRDPADGMRLADWLTAPTQRLATLTGGAVFRDPDGSLTARREALAWYPEDVWRYALAAAWLRVSQEEAFIGRTGGVGDELGSAVVGARVARDLMRLAFLVERRWAPYSKWLGTAFARLPIAERVGPRLRAALQADGWREREAELCAAQRELAVATNGLGLAEEVDPEPRQFFARDIRVLFGDRFTTALLARIADPELRALVEGRGLRYHDGTPQVTGTVDQVVDSVDVLSHAARCRAAAPLLGADGG